MKKDKPQFPIDGFEYDPKEVSDDETYEMMCACGDTPESIPDLKERKKYGKWLEKNRARVLAEYADKEDN